MCESAKFTRIQRTFNFKPQMLKRCKSLLRKKKLVDHQSSDLCAKRSGSLYRVSWQSTE